MSTKTKTTASNGETPLPPSVKINASQYADKAKKVATVTEKWFGVAPHELQEGLTSQQLPQVDEIDNLDGSEVTVLGFQKREGTFRGAASEYLIIMLQVTGEEEVKVLVTGAGVVKRKLLKCAEENALPVKGKIIKRKGPENDYFDFAS